MSRVKLVVLGMLAVFALSVGASATAAAAGTHQWIIAGTPLASGSKEEVQGDNLPFVQEGQFESTVASLNIHVYCQSTLVPIGSSNVLEGGSVGKAKVKLEFTGCALFQVTSKGVSESLPACKIKEPITAESEGELTEAGILGLKQIGSTPFSTFSIEKSNKEASCAAEGKLEVKGTQACVIPHFSVDAYTGVLLCTPGGSALTSLGNPARFYLGTGVSLTKGGKWHAT
jgi:hypothetical protein